MDALRGAGEDPKIIGEAVHSDTDKVIIHE
jgi:hypothetical protein